MIGFVVVVVVDVDDAVVAVVLVVVDVVVVVVVVVACSSRKQYLQGFGMATCQPLVCHQAKEAASPLSHSRYIYSTVGR